MPPTDEPRPVAGVGVLAAGLNFPEVPRWYDGKLWFSDGPNVMATTLKGPPRIHAALPARVVLGRGLLPDRSLLVNDMLGRRVFRVDPEGGVSVYADLSRFVDSALNEIAVRRDGVAYVGSMGFRPSRGEPPVATRLLKLDTDGTVEPVGAEVVFPNGLLLVDDDRTLLVAESFASRVTAFTVRPDGSLTDRRVICESPDSHPDGICIDREGAIWYGDPLRGIAVRVGPDGAELDRVDPDIPIVTAVALGGDDGHTLFITGAAEMPSEDFEPRGSGFLLAVRVAVGA